MLGVLQNTCTVDGHTNDSFQDTNSVQTQACGHYSGSLSSFASQMSILTTLIRTRVPASQDKCCHDSMKAFAYLY